MKTIAVLMICAGMSVGIALGFGTEVKSKNVDKVETVEIQPGGSAGEKTESVREEGRVSILAGIRNSTIDAETLSMAVQGKDAELYGFTAKDKCAMLCYPSEEQK